MLPPGLALLAVSSAAREAHRAAQLPCGYWDWDPVLAACETGSMPATPATNLVVGLRVALDLIAAEGLDAVFARHRRLADAVRAAVSHWGLEFVCAIPAARSESVTAFMLPAGVADNAVRRSLLERFGVTFGGGLGRLQDRCIRVGHLGDVDELMIVGALVALELGLPEAIDIPRGGVDAALSSLARQPAWAVP
jgi:alanine-glyoxylate transaminase/serine-glyoxylate transaminase/serine-pyruvate transaminase